MEGLIISTHKDHIEEFGQMVELTKIDDTLYYSLKAMYHPHQFILKEDVEFRQRAVEKAIGQFKVILDAIDIYQRGL